MTVNYSHWTPPMRTNYDTHFALWDRPDYQGRRVVALYSREILDWLVTQPNHGVEIYGSPFGSNTPVKVVGVPDQLYTLLALKFS